MFFKALCVKRTHTTSLLLFLLFPPSKQQQHMRSGIRKELLLLQRIFPLPPYSLVQPSLKALSSLLFLRHLPLPPLQSERIIIILKDEEKSILSSSFFLLEERWVKDKDSPKNSLEEAIKSVYESTRVGRRRRRRRMEEPHFPPSFWGINSAQEKGRDKKHKEP